MSCNGCRILRKGCSHEQCILRQSLQGIESPQAQANATVFVAKFYGRAGLMSFLSSVPQSQRPALFQSLLYEACGRTVNPVTGSVGLLSSGNWHLCQAAAETVFQGGVLALMEEFPSRMFITPPLEERDHSDATELGDVKHSDHHQSINVVSRLPARMSGGGRVLKRRAATPDDQSETTTLESCSEYICQAQSLSGRQDKPLLRRFL